MRGLDAGMFLIVDVSERMSMMRNTTQSALKQGLAEAEILHAMRARENFLR
jgi:hypothetical protein